MRKYIGLAVFLVLNLLIFDKEAISMDGLKGRKIVMIISHEGFRDEELIVPADIFRKNGAEVVVASSSLGTATGKLGAKIKADILYTQVSAGDYDAVVFVGGPGAAQYWNDQKAHQIAREAASAGKILAAICAAPATLANAGLLNGRKATAFPSPEEERQLVDGGAEYTRSGVEVDGNLVTANGPESAAKFAQEILRLLDPSLRSG